MKYSEKSCHFTEGIVELITSEETCTELQMLFEDPQQDMRISLNDQRILFHQHGFQTAYHFDFKVHQFALLPLNDLTRFADAIEASAFPSFLYIEQLLLSQYQEKYDSCGLYLEQLDLLCFMRLGNSLYECLSIFLDAEDPHVFGPLVELLKDLLIEEQIPISHLASFFYELYQYAAIRKHKGDADIVDRILRKLDHTQWFVDILHCRYQDSDAPVLLKKCRQVHPLIKDQLSALYCAIRFLQTHPKTYSSSLYESRYLHLSANDIHILLNHSPMRSRYEIIRSIPHEGYSHLYQVRDIQTQTIFTMKVINLLEWFLDLCPFSEAQDREKFTKDLHHFSAMIKDRLSALHKLFPDDENFVRGADNLIRIIDIFDIIQEEKRCYLLFMIMPYFSYSLYDLKTMMTYDLDHVTEIMLQCLEGLNQLHQHRLLHRDIKPDNIMVSNEDGRELFIIADYDLCIHFDHDHIKLQTKDAFLNTKFYAAPETSSGHYSPSSDLFSMGVLLYWLCQDDPFDQQVDFCLKQGLALTRPEHGNDAIWYVIQKATTFNPQDRYQHAQEMIKDLLRIRYGFPIFQRLDQAEYSRMQLLYLNRVFDSVNDNRFVFISDVCYRINFFRIDPFPQDEDAGPVCVTLDLKNMDNGKKELFQLTDASDTWISCQAENHPAKMYRQNLTVNRILRYFSSIGIFACISLVAFSCSALTSSLSPFILALIPQLTVIFIYQRYLHLYVANRKHFSELKVHHLRCFFAHFLSPLISTFIFALAFYLLCSDDIHARTVNLFSVFNMPDIRFILVSQYFIWYYVIYSRLDHFKNKFAFEEDRNACYIHEENEYIFLHEYHPLFYPVFNTVMNSMTLLISAWILRLYFNSLTALSSLLQYTGLLIFLLISIGTILVTRYLLWPVFLRLIKRKNPPVN